ncbi:MAG: VPLPA-CTERM sorting domain-containing protein [Pseudomonadota bacterium]
MKKTFAIAAAMFAFAGGASASTIDATFWDASRGFGTIDQAISYAETNEATATFTSTAVDYPNAGKVVRSGLTTISDFIGADVSSLVGDGSATLGESVFRFSGRLALAPGTYNISVGSDDGFRLFFGGTNVAEQVRPRAFRLTNRTVEVTGNTDFVLYYYENYGRTGVEFRVDNDIVDTADLVPVPLPAGLPMLLAGLLGLGYVARRRKI